MDDALVGGDDDESGAVEVVFGEVRLDDRRDGGEVALGRGGGGGRLRGLGRRRLDDVGCGVVVAAAGRCDDDGDHEQERDAAHRSSLAVSADGQARVEAFSDGALDVADALAVADLDDVDAAGAQGVGNRRVTHEAGGDDDRIGGGGVLGVADGGSAPGRR